MSITGIIAEFNPLHTGHKYLIDQAKSQGAVVCVISGNFVQRGDTAIFEKSIRTEAALNCGVDLVLELPVCYSMSTAQNFAIGSVNILDAVGCDTLLFGSECGKTDVLLKTAQILNGSDFQKNLTKYLKKGLTFALSRQYAAEDSGAPKNILNTANNNLAIEYMLAAENIGSKLNFKTYKRIGAEHDSGDISGDFASASALREMIKTGNFNLCEKYFPTETKDLFLKSDFSDISLLETAILTDLRLKNPSDFSNLPDLSEGIQNKLYSEIKLANTLAQLYNGMKVKRYTLARIRRLVLSAFLQLDNELFLKTPPYLRVLGFNKTGEKIIKQNSSCSKIPFVMRAGEINGLGEKAQKLFSAENRATDVYALSLKNPFVCGLEHTRQLIKF